MLTRAGIEYSESNAPNVITERPCARTLDVEAGYPGFMSVLGFDERGALVTIEAYE